MVGDGPPPATIICGSGEVGTLHYQRYEEQDLDDDEEDGLFYDTSCARDSCHRALDFKDRYLAPASPERASGAWMLINAFMLVWSFSLGAYIASLYWWYDGKDGSNNPASRESTTDYLVWSLLTTLVWMAEISLRAAFPAVGIVVKIANSNSSSNGDDDVEAQEMDDRTTTHTVKSVVTIEEIVHKRSPRHNAVIATELLLAIYFGTETIQNCYHYWEVRHRAYNPWDDDAESEFFSMLQQQSDIWISVLAYAYMTYETYLAYYRSISTKRNIQRSLSTTALSDLPPFPDIVSGGSAVVYTVPTVRSKARAKMQPAVDAAEGLLAATGDANIRKAGNPNQ